MRNRKRSRLVRLFDRYFVGAVAVLAMFAGACSSVTKKTPALESPVESSPTVAEASPDATDGPVPTLYTIKSGDTLWGISKKAYADPYLWPLVFNENINRIADPDLINPGQEIGIPRNYSESVEHYARDFAFRTEPFRSHAKPDRTKYRH